MRNESGQRGDYVQRVNRAIDHILHHLGEPLPLESVAREADFSAFHFHRIFKSLTGETLHQFVKRLRLERSLRLLSFEPGRSLTDVALECGFQSSSDFSRSFKQAFGVPPSEFDLQAFRAQRREEWQATITDSATRHLLDPLPVGENPDGFAVKLRRLPARHVAYIRVPDPYRPTAVPDATAELVAWAEARGLADSVWLGYMWDDPEIVAHADCRYDVGVEVDHLEPDGEIGRIDFPPMRVAQVEVVGDIALEQRALDWLFGTWLRDSGYVPTDQPCFEAWIGRPFAHGYEHFELWAHLPIERG